MSFDFLKYRIRYAKQNTHFLLIETTLEHIFHWTFLERFGCDKRKLQIGIGQEAFRSSARHNIRIFRMSL